MGGTVLASRAITISGAMMYWLGLSSSPSTLKGEIPLTMAQALSRSGMNLAQASA